MGAADGIIILLYWDLAAAPLAQPRSMDGETTNIACAYHSDDTGCETSYLIYPTPVPIALRGQHSHRARIYDQRRRGNVVRQ